MRFENILEWFSGKSREAIVTHTIPALIESAELGYWKKGVARAVRAALNKQNVAKRWARDVETELGVDYRHPLRDALSNMRFGSYGRAPSMLTAEALGKLYQHSYLLTRRGLAVDVNDTIERWARANAEVAELVALLDERRPKPVIVMKTLSPTVAETISQHIGIDIATIQSPPMRGEWIEHEYKGKKCLVFEIFIDWPEGTQHNKSCFFHSGNHMQCQACGHAIKDPFNWVPILAYGKKDCECPPTWSCPSHGSSQRTPYSLWVGRDCARKLFGCEIEGDAIYRDRQS